MLVFVLQLKIQSTYSQKNLPVSRNKFTAGVFCLDDSGQSVLRPLAAIKPILQNVAAASAFIGCSIIIDESTHSPKKLESTSSLSWSLLSQLTTPVNLLLFESMIIRVVLLLTTQRQPGAVQFAPNMLPYLRNKLTEKSRRNVHQFWDPKFKLKIC